MSNFGNKPLLGTGRFYIPFDDLEAMVNYDYHPEILDAVLRLYVFLSYQRISLYSGPVDYPSTVDDDQRLANITMHTKEEWLAIREKVSRHFDIRDGRWWLRGENFHISRGTRPGLAPTLRQAVFDRDGFICAYCQTEEGPFQIDHIHPVARGGKDVLDNLAVACGPCNRDKSDKLLEEWRP